MILNELKETDLSVVCCTNIARTPSMLMLFRMWTSNLRSWIPPRNRPHQPEVCVIYGKRYALSELKISHADPTKACWDLSLNPESPPLQQSPGRSPALLPQCSRGYFLPGLPGEASLNACLSAVITSLPHWCGTLAK